MRVLCVVPARIGSQRLPHKPLQRLGGQSLISIVASRVFEFGLFDDIVVATDHEDVCRAVADLPVEAVMTSPDHRCGTDRVAEVARTRANEFIVNVQGDEPFVSRQASSAVLGLLRGGAGLATVGTELVGSDVKNPNTTKVSVSGEGLARGFARQMSDLAYGQGDWVGRHVGIYGYRRSTLLEWAAAPPTADERALGLEQLRPMAYKEPIAVARVADVGGPGIDTIEDLEQAERYMTALSERVHA